MLTNDDLLDIANLHVEALSEAAEIAQFDRNYKNAILFSTLGRGYVAAQRKILDKVRRSHDY